MRVISRPVSPSSLVASCIARGESSSSFGGGSGRCAAISLKVHLLHWQLALRRSMERSQVLNVHRVRTYGSAGDPVLVLRSGRVGKALPGGSFLASLPRHRHEAAII